jgi:pimeloyl-ACP methyl ester carboxylesterase
MKQSPHWPVLQSIAPTIAYDARFVAAGADFATRWKTVTTPVLVTNGTDSFPFFPPICDAVAKALPNGSRRTIPGGHGPSAEVIARLSGSFSLPEARLKKRSGGVSIRSPPARHEGEGKQMRAAT